MAPTVVKNQQWAYLGLYRNGRVAPKLGKPDPYFVLDGSGYQQRRGDPTLDPLAVARQYAGNIDILPGRSGLGLYVPGKTTIAASITFSEQGAALQWPPAPEEKIQGYHIERSHEPNHPLWSFRRITASPQKGLTKQDLWAWEGDPVAYRIYTVLEDGSLSLRADLRGVQTPFCPPDKYVTQTLVMTDANTTAGKPTYVEGFHFRPGERQHCVKVTTKNLVIIRRCSGLTSADFCNANGGGNVRLEHCFIKGQIPATKDYSAGSAMKGDYQTSFGANNNLVRELAGWYLPQWRGPSAANGGPITQIHSNVYHNIHRKRSDGQGGSLAEETIASVYREGVRGRTNPSKADGFTVPVGWDFAQVLKLDGTGAAKDGLPAYFFGGMAFRGNLMIQEPGRGLGEDAFNFYFMGGEPNRWIQIQGYCVIGNWGNGINAAGQPWQPGMPWHMGGNKQPPGNYFPGVTQPAGEFKLPFQSMTGGLQADGASTTRYVATGAYTLVEDAWLIGPGTMLGAQHGNNHLIRRAKVLYSGTDQSGTLTVSGDPRIGVYMDNGEGTLLVEGQRLSHHLGIQDSVTVAPISDSNKLPQGFSTKWTDPALTSGNTVVNRLATRAEEEAGYHEFLIWCETNGLALGPQFPVPAVVYS